jgi:hypothetical protein
MIAKLTTGCGSNSELAAGPGTRADVAGPLR